ncbi:TIGR02587 family membrane protein [Croceibacterium aestuarii]|uniref:TIGR02587 family membrane protein n=1 Tax=Croceibacterium aestuarii TaxID=3064139 RepID=UPI003F718E32
MTRSGSREVSNAEYARGLARAAAGALIFSFPLIMTMEMWWLGFYLDRVRLLLLLVLTFALLVPLSRLVGFERTNSVAHDVIDALAAFAIGGITSAVLLAVFGIVDASMPTSEIVGKIALQTVPASIGALLARGQLAGESDGEGERNKGDYATDLFIMLVGAIFLAFNVAPTGEMILIAFKMSYWNTLVLIFLSIALLHAFVYALGFAGQKDAPENTSFIASVVRYSVVGYGIAVLVSLYVLWTFGRIEGAALEQIATMTAVLGFPAALGAASARLII